MRLPVFLKSLSKEGWPVALIAAIVAATFTTDLLTPPGVAVGVFPYFVAIFATIRLPWRAAPYVVATAASILALVGFYASATPPPTIILINRICVIVALYIFAYLAAHWIRSGNLVIERRAEEETESRYRDLFDTSPLGIQIADHNGNRLRVNKALVDMLGCESAEEVLSRDQLAFIAPQDRPNALARLRLDAAGEKLPSPYEIDLVRKDGSVFRTQVFWRKTEWEGQSATIRNFIDITDRYRAEQARAESDARYRALFDASPLGLHIADLGNRRLRVNRAFAEMLGYDSAAEVMALPPRIIIAPHVREEAMKRAEGEIASGELSGPYEIDLVRKDGVFMRAQIFSLWIEWDGKPAIQRTAIDVTERYRAERALTESNATYRDLFDGSRLGQHISNPDGQRLMINQALASLLGYDSPAEVTALPPFAFAAPHDRTGAAARSIADGAGGVLPDSYEIDLVRKDGAAIRAQVYVRRIVWDGAPATQRTFIDVTERHQAQQQLAENEARYRDLIEGSRLALQISDNNGENLLFNQAAADLLGYESVAEMMPRDSRSFVAPYDRGNTVTMDAIDAAEGDLPKSYEIDLIRKDGSFVRVQVFWRAVHWEGERVLQRTFIDVTERYRAQEQLSENEERLRLMLNAMGDGLLGIDDRGHCTFCNPVAVRLLGFGDASDIIGRNMHALVHNRYPDGSPYPESACGIHRTIREDRITEETRETFWRADGTPIPVAFRALPIHKGDTVVGAVLTFCDLTRSRADAATRKAQDETIRALQRELSEAARESALGELSSVIAHELNQPLTAIRSTADAAKRQLAGSAPGRMDTLAEMLPFLSEQAERAGKVLDGVRRMFQRDTPERSRENLYGVISEACLLARREFGPDGVTIKWTPGTDTATVIIDRIQIQQVIYNLIKNAAQAMSGMSDKTVSVGTAKTGRQTVEVRVSDKGPGIAPDAGARMFEPFVTTKEHGMGMGLHACRTIVRARVGEIGIDPADTEGGSGATIRFTLRLTE